MDNTTTVLIEEGGGGKPQHDGRRHMLVPVWGFWLLGVVVCLLVTSQATLWAYTLHESRERGEVDNGYNAQISTKQEAQGDKVKIKRKRSPDMDAMTIEEGMVMEENLRQLITKTKPLSAHLVASPQYGHTYIIQSPYSPILWEAHRQLAQTHNDVFTQRGTSLVVQTTGHYYLSLTVVFNGRDPSNTWRETPTCTLKVVIQRRTSNRTVMVAATTQYLGGRAITDGSSQRFAFDTVHVSGSFLLHHNDTVVVRPDMWSVGCRIAMTTDRLDRTFIDAILLSTSSTLDVHQ